MRLFNCPIAEMSVCESFYYFRFRGNVFRHLQTENSVIFANDVSCLLRSMLFVFSGIVCLVNRIISGLSLLGTSMFICQGTSTTCQRSDLFGLRVKLPPVTTSLNHLGKDNPVKYLGKDRASELPAPFNAKCEAGAKFLSILALPLPFGCRSACVYAVCNRCLSSSSLFYPSGPISSSFSAEFLVLEEGLE